MRISKHEQMSVDALLLLSRYNVDLRPDSKNNHISLININTFGAIDKELLHNIQNNSTIDTTKLQVLLNQHLKMYYLYDAIVNTLKKNQKELKIFTLVNILIKGEFYAELKQNIIINNRTTPNNINILIAALLILAANKMTMEEIKRALVIFYLQQKQDELEGVFFEQKIIMNMLKKINKTINENGLKKWMMNSHIEHFLMPQQFLYLACLATNRDTYLKKINGVNFKNNRMKGSKLYTIQPLKQVYGTPDYKIQQMLTVSQQYLAQKSNNKKYKQNVLFENKNATRQQTNISNFKKLLRNQNMFRQIKECLIENKSKSKSIQKCLDSMHSQKKIRKRPYSSITPILRDITQGMQFQSMFFTAVASRPQTGKSHNRIKMTKPDREQLRKLYKKQTKESRLSKLELDFNQLISEC